jgi:hypothetical protein
VGKQESRKTGKCSGAAASRAKPTVSNILQPASIQYNRALGLKNTAETYRKSLSTTNSTELLKKALDAV